MKLIPSQMIQRNHCVFSGNEDLEPLHVFKNFPIFMGCTDQPFENDLFADMQWHISKSSGSIQLNPLVPLDILYQEQHVEPIGEVWTEHHRLFSEFINRGAPQQVLEIGGAHGTLARNYLHLQKNAQWTTIEPNSTATTTDRFRVLPGFFDEQYVYDREIDGFVHSHVLEHIYEPMKFFSSIASFLNSGGNLYFSVPNLQRLLESRFTNCLNFEHSVYITEAFVDFALLSHGFDILSKEYYRDHSIFYKCTKKNTVHKPLLPNHYLQNANTFKTFISYHDSLISDLNSKIQKSSEPVFLFGAHIFSQYLLSWGLDSSCIISSLDNSEKKQGRRLYGTHLKVQSPKILSQYDRPKVILKAGGYTEEIRNSILNNINANTVFLE